MKDDSEYRIICEGNFADVNEAKNALHAPFIEELVEETGKFSFQDLDNIRVTNKISLADLEIAQISESMFEITCPNAQVPLNKPKAEKLANNLRKMTMFDDVYVETFGD